MMKSVETEWKDFEAKSMSPECGDQQRREMRIAFYCGVLATYDLMRTVENNKVPQEEWVSAMDKVNEELAEFVQQYMHTSQ